MNDSNWLIPLSVALGGFFFFYAIANWVWNLRDPARRGIAELQDDRLTRAWFGRQAWEVVAPLGTSLLPFFGAEGKRLTEQLQMAGLRRSSAPASFVLSKIGLVLVAAAAIWSLWQFPNAMSDIQRMLLAAVLAISAILLPNWWLQRKIKLRQARLRNGFPDSLDMLVICVEAGLGLSAAMERVTDEIRHMHPDLAMELATVNAEIRSGIDRGTALRGLNTRTGLPEIRGFVSLLTQTLQLGTGVAESLRIYAEEFRDQRMHRAEERAAKTGTKMIFPLVLCEFPAFFLIAVGPATLRLIDAFSA
jgi:tight adherence protein C